MKRRRTRSNILALCLALMMTVALLSSTVFAAITPDATGTITVEKVEDGLKVSAYRLMDVKVSGNGQPQDPVYSWVDDVSDWVREKYPNYIGKDQDNAVQSAFNDAATTSDIALFYDQLAAAIRDNTLNLTAAKTATSSQGAAVLTEMKMGNYLILIENGMKVYRPSAVNLVPEWNETENAWNMSDATVEIKSSEPTITKTVTDASKKQDNYNIGDPVNFTIVADVPNFPENALAKHYFISDILPEGLTLNPDSIKVFGLSNDSAEVTLAIETAYTQSSERPEGVQGNRNTSFTLNFNYDQIKTYTKIKVMYSAVLNEKAVLGKTGNSNNAVLDYSNNPYDTNSWQTKDDKATVYTYGLDISKVDKSNHQVFLEGAIFELYASKEDATSDDSTKAIRFVEESDGVYRRALTDDTNSVTNLEVGASDSMKGKLTIKGLDEGTWYLKETVAPGGYNKLAGPIEITISDEENGIIDGILANNHSNGLLPLTVENDKGFRLPVTGGMGTIIFTTVGILLMGAGIFLLLLIRRKINGNEH